MDIQKLRAEVFEKHNRVLGENDPVFDLVVLNEVILNELIKSAEDTFSSISDEIIQKTRELQSSIETHESSVKDTISDQTVEIKKLISELASSHVKAEIGSQIAESLHDLKMASEQSRQALIEGLSTAIQIIRDERSIVIDDMEKSTEALRIATEAMNESKSTLIEAKKAYNIAKKSHDDAKNDNGQNLRWAIIIGSTAIAVSIVFSLAVPHFIK